MLMLILFLGVFSTWFLKSLENKIGYHVNTDKTTRIGRGVELFGTVLSVQPCSLKEAL